MSGFWRRYLMVAYVPDPCKIIAGQSVFLESQIPMNRLLAAAVPPILFRIVIWAALANLAVFLLLRLHFGLTAFGGKIEGDHFFLGDSENFVETSCRIYRFCLWQGGSLFVTNPLGALASLALHLKTGEMI
jgi:hypothetical protein